MVKTQKQDTQSRAIVSILLRYSSILIIALVFFYSEFFYKLFLFPTIYSIKSLLGFFYNVNVSGNIILVNSSAIEIIPACVAVSAYLLLLILNMTTPMDWKKRAYSLAFSILSLLIVNILRISLLSLLWINNYAYYDIIHKLFWYVLSILFVIGIWFASTFLFKIKSIPAYGDLKFMISLIRKKYKH